MTGSSQFEVSVVVFREDAEWTAVALEMNIRGYGRTRVDAMDDLVQMLIAQISFAVQKGHPESVWHPADEKFWRMFEEARRNEFMAKVSGSEIPSDGMTADLVPLSLVAAAQERSDWSSSRA